MRSGEREKNGERKGRGMRERKGDETRDASKKGGKGIKKKKKMKRWWKDSLVDFEAKEIDGKWGRREKERISDG